MDGKVRSYPQIQHLVGGEYLDGPAGRPVLNPATGEALSSIPQADVALLDRSAKLAFEGFRQWHRTPAYDRAAILKKSAALMRERVEVLAWTITVEQGKPLRESRGEVLGTASIFEWLADESCRISSEVLASRIPGMQQVIHHEPIGPVLAIAPWNMPAMMAGRKIAHALSSGCSVIVKPASETPAIVMALARVLLDAGLPENVIQIVHGNSDAIARFLIAAPEIRKVSFTGSTEVGRILGALCGHHIKRFTAELGGHAPVVICPDADVEQAATILAGGKFFNAGQSCMAPTRFLVHGAIVDAFTEAFTAEVARIKVGNGLDEGNGMGALVNSRAVTAMGEFVADTRSHGGQVTTGGERPAGEGAFFQPTVLANVPLAARVMNDEPYGPIAAITAYESQEEAVRISNSLPFGLCAYVFGRDLKRAEDIAAEIEAGLVGINTLNVGGSMVPFGGVKDSGLGREGSRYGLHEHLVTKTITRM